VSYCRWSSDDFQCDVYVYEDVYGGWRTHVAGNRPVFETPLPEPVAWNPDDDAAMRAYFERDRVVMRMVGDAARVPIGLSHDGATFDDPTPGACADTLLMLREAGYQVPQYAIDELREEADAARVIPVSTA